VACSSECGKVSWTSVSLNCAEFMREFFELVTQ
jgi:hypothetical protein